MSRRGTLLGWLDAMGIAVVIVVTVWSLHPQLLVSSSLITGGDTGSHMVIPAFLRSQGDLLHVTPWYPGWFAGMPAYSYYFVLPDYVAVLVSYLVGFAVAFKFATILGSLLMPIAAYVMGRLFRAPRPVPVALAVATLPFLFDTTFTIDGGNLYSTMAGEYAFSLSLALAMITIGLFARGVRSGRGYWWAAISLSLTLAAHLLPWMFTVAMVGFLVLLETWQHRGHGERGDRPAEGDRARPWRFAIGAGLLSAALSAWWLLPFGTSQSLTNSMGYTNNNVSSLHSIFTTLGWWTATGSAGGDRWVITLALISAVVAVVSRRRLGLVLTLWTLGSLAAYVLDPQSVIWNERLIPFWFLGIHLLAGWGVGDTTYRWAQRIPRRLVRELAGESPDLEPHGWRDEVVRREIFSRMANATAAVILLGALSTVPGLIPASATVLGLNTSGNEVTNWAQWNYSGYQAKTAWPEYHDLMSTMAHVGKVDGCGRAMWEYSSGENRFGTPMALMLLPYWTNNCIGSMEGLFFESSPTTPYHFLDQAELSAAPSDPQVGLPYGALNVAEGVTHLQELGVRYFVAFSPSVIAQASHVSALVPIATTQHWPSPGATWHIYLVKQSPMVVGLSHDPIVVTSLTSRVAWLNANVDWWLDPARSSTPLAATGPKSWPRSTAPITITPPTDSFAPAQVSDVVTSSQGISFHVDRVNTPVLVKISYYPRWQVHGATGPYRVSPNLMVVVPTSTTVSLHYGADPAVTWGSRLSELTLLVAAVVAVQWLVRRRRSQGRMQEHGH